jgi:hypothetical protein
MVFATHQKPCPLGLMCVILKGFIMQNMPPLAQVVQLNYPCINPNKRTFAQRAHTFIALLAYGYTQGVQPLKRLVNKANFICAKYKKRTRQV